MPKITRSNEEIGKVKDQIIEGALEILSTEGYDSLSMSKLGARMDMTAANLYNYYKNKNELLIAIHKKTFGMLYEKMKENVESAEDPREKISRLVDAFIEFGTTNVHVYDIMFNRSIPQYTDYIGTPQEALAFDEYQSSMQAFFFAVKTVSQYLETRPEKKQEDSKFTAIKLFSTLHGIISLYNSRILYEIDSHADLILRGIRDDILNQIFRGRV